MKILTSNVAYFLLASTLTVAWSCTTPPNAGRDDDEDEEDETDNDTGGKGGRGGGGGRGGSGGSGGRGGSGGAGGMAGRGGSGGSSGNGGSGGSSGNGGSGGSSGSGGMGGMSGSGGSGGNGGNGGMSGTGGASGMGGMSADAGVDAAGGMVTVDAAVDAPVEVDAPVASPDAGVTDAANVDGATPSALLAWDSFDGTGRLNGQTTGAGWGAAWAVNNDDANTPGYAIVNTTPLTYMTLKTTAPYGTGGQSYRESGRRFDVAAQGAFANVLNASNRIGAPGTTLWVSFLFRKQSADDNPLRVAFHNSNAPFWDGDPGAPTTFSLGFFGADSTDAGTRYWSAQLAKTSAVVRSTAPVTIGQVALFVAQVSFAQTGGTVRVYINPTSLGGQPPASPTLELTSAVDLAFSSLMFYPGSAVDSGSIDEIRVGTTYAAVTPTN